MRNKRSLRIYYISFYMRTALLQLFRYFTVTVSVNLENTDLELSSPTQFTRPTPPDATELSSRRRRDDATV